MHTATHPYAVPASIGSGVREWGSMHTRMCTHTHTYTHTATHTYAVPASIGSGVRELGSMHTRKHTQQLKHMQCQPQQTAEKGCGGACTHARTHAHSNLHTCSATSTGLVVSVAST
eukprot:1141269-Pelagomonas_calceolata.AAC.2